MIHDRKSPFGLAEPDNQLDIPRRIRQKRKDLDLTLSQLAERVENPNRQGRPHITAGYLSLIEQGGRKPDEEIAVGLARALGENEELYRAWASGELETAKKLISNLRRDPRIRNVLVATGEDADLILELLRGDEERLRRLVRTSSPGGPGMPVLPEVTMTPAGVAAGEFAPEGIVTVSVIAEGEVPGSPDDLQHLRHDVLRLDSRLLPRSDATRLFAYRLSEAGVRRVRDVLSAGDHVVIARGYAPETPDSIFLVRHGGTHVLSRIAFRSGLMLLLPAAGESDVEVVEAHDPSSVLVGRVVLVVRRCV